MGWLSRKGRGEGDASAPPSDGGGPEAAAPGKPAFEGTPVAEPLTEADSARIRERLEELTARGVDVDDVGSISAAYDDARAGKGREPGGDGSEMLVDLFAIGIGEHLARHSARQWAIVTDAFGTDLGLATARSDSIVVPHNLVSARWMRGEVGWIPGVVAHLRSLHPRR